MLNRFCTNNNIVHRLSSGSCNPLKLVGESSEFYVKYIIGRERYIENGHIGTINNIT